MHIVIILRNSLFNFYFIITHTSTIKQSGLKIRVQALGSVICCVAVQIVLLFHSTDKQSQLFTLTNEITAHFVLHHLHRWPGLAGLWRQKHQQQHFMETIAYTLISNPLLLYLSACVGYKKL